MPNGDSNESNGTRGRGVWDFLGLLLFLAAFVAIVVWVTLHYGTRAKDAASILGVVIPVFTAVGAALVGAAAGFKAGETKGVEGKAEAASTAKQRLAGQVRPSLAVAEQQLDLIATEIERSFASPAGANYLFAPRGTLGGREAPRIRSSDIAACRSSLAAARAALESA
jgi:hypothetical protein